MQNNTRMKRNIYEIFVSRTPPISAYTLTGSHNMSHLTVSIIEKLYNTVLLTTAMLKNYFRLNKLREFTQGLNKKRLFFILFKGLLYLKDDYLTSYVFDLLRSHFFILYFMITQYLIIYLLLLFF